MKIIKSIFIFAGAFFIILLFNVIFIGLVVFNKMGAEYLSDVNGIGSFALMLISLLGGSILTFILEEKK